MESGLSSSCSIFLRNNYPKAIEKKDKEAMVAHIEKRQDFMIRVQDAVERLLLLSAC